MPSKSVAQRKFFGFLKGNPKEAQKRGIAGKVVDEYASTPEKGLPKRLGKPMKKDKDGDYDGGVCPTCGK